MTITESDGTVSEYGHLVDYINKVEISYFDTLKYWTIDDVYNDFSKNFETYKELYAKNGIVLGSINRKEYGGVEWVLVDAVQDNTYEFYMAYSALGNYHIADGWLMNIGELSDESVFTQLSNMFKQATYNGTKNFSEDDNSEKEEMKKNYDTKFTPVIDVE